MSNTNTTDSHQEISQKLQQRKLSAIVIDTTEFDGRKLKLHSGLLNRLDEFSFAGIQFLMPDVIYRELLSHLIEHAESIQTNILNALGTASDCWELSSDAATQIKETIFQSKSPEDQAKERLGRYLHKTQCNILPAEENARMTPLINLYFDAQPPFEAQGKKKSEFPDAIALLTVDQWATDNDACVLVVSRDKGWLDYCKNSDKLIPLKHLQLAFGYLETLQAKAQITCDAFMQLYGLGKEASLESDLHDALQHSIGDLTIDVQAATADSYEDEVLGVTIKDYELQTIGDNDGMIIPISYSPKKIIVSVNVLANVTVTIEFKFFKFDSIDRDYIPFGSNTARIDTEAQLECLITLDGDFEKNPKAFIIDALEIEWHDIEIDIEGIEPSWKDDHWP